MQRFFKCDREELVFGLEAATVGALFEVWPVSPIESLDLFARVGVVADNPRQRKESEGLLQGDRVESHGLEEGCGLRFALLILLHGELNVRAITARPGDHRLAGFGVVTELTVAGGGCEQLFGLLECQLIGGEIFRDTHTLVATLEVGAVSPAA